MIIVSNLQKLPPLGFRYRWGKKTYTSLLRIFSRYFNEDLQVIPAFVFNHHIGTSVWYPVTPQAAKNIDAVVSEFMESIGPYKEEDVSLSYFELDTHWNVPPKVTFSFTGATSTRNIDSWYKIIKGKQYNIKLFTFKTPQVCQPKQKKTKRK